MAIKVQNPTTNGQRDTSYLIRDDISNQSNPVRSLSKIGKKVTGRGNGRITIRHRGGGTRPKYRMVDFNGTDKLGIPGTIRAIEYDPNRTAHIALVFFVDGEKRYILAHKGAKEGDNYSTDIKSKPVTGMRMQLANIPVGFKIFNLEITANRGGQAVRSAGQSATLVSLESDRAQVRMPSGEIRLVDKTNYATIGSVSNEELSLVRIGKAGRVRHSGRRPQVRGKVMNPCDHPHGGGEAANSIGMKYPKTPWGAPALGVKTRRNKSTNRDILQSRHRAKKR